MQELILYIKPQQRDKTAQNYVKVDLFTDENVSLTQVIQDVRDIDKVFTDYSRTFNLPASEKNNKLFKHWYNPDVKGFDANIQSDAKIELNYQPFREGKIRLQEVKMKDNRPHTYKITFFGKTVSLNNLFGEDKLNNLVWMDNFKLPALTANVLTGLQTGHNITVDSVTYNSAIIYPLITHTQRYIYDDTGSLTDVGNLSDDSTNDKTRGVFPEDLKPAIKASLVIKAIEEQYNLTFKTGEFFDSTEFSNLYLWLHRDKGKIETKNSLVVDSTAFTCGGNPSTGSDGPSTIVPSSNLCALYTAAPTQFTNGVYKVTKTTNFSTDNYDFFYDVSITPASGFTSVIYDIIIFDALTGDTLAFETNTGNGSKQILLDTASNPMAIGESKHITTRIETTAASFEFEATITVGQTVTETVGSPLTDRCFFVSNSANVPVTIDDIRPTEQVPDIKVLDFLKGIFKMFNLTAFLDSSDRVVVKTLDDFYSDSTTTHDISKFIVKDEHTVSEALPFSNIKFEYPEAKTKLAQAFYNLNNVEYGSLNYIADASQGSKYEVLPPFEHMLFERLSDGTTKVNTDVQYGLAVDDDDNSVVTAPLLFYGIYNTSISTPINYVDSTRPVTSVSGITNTTINNYWMPHNANELGSTSTAPAFNLNFGSEINSYTLTDYGGSNNSLFQKFYQTYIQRVFNTKTRIFKYKAVLPLKFLLTYSLADKVFISGRAFTINKITTDLQTGRSTLELLNEPS
tara:strand:+ start:513 stop:2732 length:2220 start_codon:yes stop_codon:yes gene_type:complete